jgi:hypothetical protein
MTPTSFSFTLTMPGDERFVGAIRLLAAQAASYAQLPAAAGEALASQVERATASAIAAARADAPLDFTFSGDERRVAVQIGCTAATPVAAPAASSGGASVRWSVDGARLTCRIEHPAA